MLLDVTAAYLPDRTDNDVALSVLGALFTQPVISAVLLTVAPIPSSIRGIAAASIFGVGVMGTLGFGLSADRENGLVIAVSTLFQWCACVAILASVRRRFQLQPMTTLILERSHSPSNDGSFGIRHMLMITMAMAVVAATARRAIPGLATLEIDPNQFDSSHWELAQAMLIGNTLGILPTMFAMFVNRHLLLWLLASAAWLWLGTQLEFLVLDEAYHEEIWVLNWAQFFATILTLNTLRFLGWRWRPVREPSPASPKLPQASEEQC
ncbi:MAG: hypothetical protein KDB14_09660 [Planctomycetales bacterium]|nr:hypothetical protein [Planctomycetales bacterium]